VGNEKDINMVGQVMKCIEGMIIPCFVIFGVISKIVTTKRGMIIPSMRFISNKQSFNVWKVWQEAQQGHQDVQ
jgi:hypothetical protein